MNALSINPDVYIVLIIGYDTPLPDIVKEKQLQYDIILRPSTKSKIFEVIDSVLEKKRKLQNESQGGGN